MDIKGTKTEKNLMEAFAGESQARNKYTYFASKARKEGYIQIANIFEETAANEKEHAKIWYKYLHGGEVGTTIENLEDAANGENYERICTTAWQRKLVKRALQRSPLALRWSERSKKSMKNATESCSRMSKRVSYSQRTATRSGNALTADTSLSERKHPRCALYALILSHTLRFARKTINFSFHYRHGVTAI